MNTSRKKRNIRFMHRNIEAMFCMNITIRLVIVSAKPRKQEVVGGAEGRLHPIQFILSTKLIHPLITVDRTKKIGVAILLIENVARQQ